MNTKRVIKLLDMAYQSAIDNDDMDMVIGCIAEAKAIVEEDFSTFDNQLNEVE
jgi:hypothetical protein